MKTREILCKSAIGKCGFPGGGWAINPYVGCEHGCVFCYARFIKRFTGHTEGWGTFVDARVNIADVLAKQMRSAKFQSGRIYLGTVTDPYQPLEEKYQLTRKILKVLVNHSNPVSILTKSDMVLRDFDLLRQLKEVDVNFTVATLDKKWKKLVEPHSPSIEQRFKAMRKLVAEGVTVLVMMGPYWPFFTESEKLFQGFKKAGVSNVFTESFNTTGGNWAGVEEVLKKHYSKLLPKMRQMMFNKKKFDQFYCQAEKEVRALSKKYQIPVTIYFATGHAAKFKS